MTGARFLLGFLTLPLLGLGIWGLPGIAKLSRAARIAAAAAAGALFLTVEMFLFHLVGVRWSVPMLAAPLLLFSVVGWLRSRRYRQDRSATRESSSPAVLLTLFALLLAAYAAATARATSVDLLLFWGPKAARFAAARGVDIAFLADPGNRFIHPDYPPLPTFLYAWGTMIAGRFPWGAVLLTLPLFLTLAALAFWGIARTAWKPRPAAESTAVLTALLAFASVASLSAGNAEPPLLFFETLALAAIVFGRGRDDLDPVVALGLAGAVWTKVEGAVFAALAAGIFLWLNRARPGAWKRFLRVASPATVLLGGWIGWAGHHELLQGYRGTTYGPFSAARWRTVLSAIVANADYGVFYLPWMTVLVLLVISRRRAISGPLLIAAGVYLLFVVFSYLHGGVDQTAWISWSAERLLMTPLLLLFFASVSAPHRRIQALGADDGHEAR